MGHTLPDGGCNRIGRLSQPFRLHPTGDGTGLRPGHAAPRTPSFGSPRRPPEATPLPVGPWGVNTVTVPSRRAGYTRSDHNIAPCALAAQARAVHRVTGRIPADVSPQWSPSRPRPRGGVRGGLPAGLWRPGAAGGVLPDGSARILHLEERGIAASRRQAPWRGAASRAARAPEQGRAQRAAARGASGPTAAATAHPQVTRPPRRSCWQDAGG